VRHTPDVTRLSAPAALLAAVLAGLLLALGLAVPASAAEEFTVTPGRTTMVNGPEGSPAIDLDHDLYVPAGASAADPRPAIVITNGFGLSKSAAEVTATASFLARNGYLVLAYTAAGFGESGGCITLQSADFDARGTEQLVDAVLEPRTDVMRDADGLVLGTVGGSYGGGGQLVYAAQDDRVRAAAPAARGTCCGTR
jgi:dienelactone hydrolase